MIELRPFNTLGAANHGWLDAHHHFSFAGYHDPSRVNWGALRVWNDDKIAPKSGFPTHPHQDMEIITYVRSGAITHRDSMGNEGRTEAGDVQVMSAGRGVAHSEFNLEDEETTLFQIWIIPSERGGDPSWGARQFPKGDRAGQFVPLASGAADDDDALRIRTDARVLGATVKAGESVTYTPAQADRHLYLVPATGSIRVGDIEAKARDGIAITKEDSITITALEDSELVLVDAA
ncbi:pirin family protein [Qipengyuania gaetbuli]|uniref:pirin family protein n=1 Tax=Qipengyuania gaetbuli TaxID=266952 RepID=UPI001CD671FB|nr:pirin family protein [Qipengyuania gaetbuli]MCA0909093.1 pirin family protein [Qipengyuania gaetbuli]